MAENETEQVEENNEAKTDLADYCKSRSQTYALFARIIDREIDAKTCELIRTTAKDLGGDTVSDDPEQQVIEGIRGMADDLYGFDADMENDLAVDYGHVFLAAGFYEDKCATPYESVYTSEEGLLMQDARDQVRALYREAKVMPNTDGTIPEDFAPFELDYMGVLNDRIADSLVGHGGYDPAKLAQDQLSFYTDHIANWMGQMLADVDRVAKTAFYHHFAQAMRGFIACENEDLPELVQACAPFAKPTAATAE